MTEDPDFFGDDYTPSIDRERLLSGIARVRLFMSDGGWHSLAEISKACKVPEATASADLRALRRERYGGYIIDRRRRVPTGGTYEYRMKRKEDV